MPKSARCGFWCPISSSRSLSVKRVKMPAWLPSWPGPRLIFSPTVFSKAT